MASSIGGHRAWAPQVLILMVLAERSSHNTTASAAYYDEEEEEVVARCIVGDWHCSVLHNIMKVAVRQVHA